ncbi:MAG: transposase, partial [Actinobacteria bacterium]|nr:transposase [Actinomycetota bacterium]
LELTDTQADAVALLALVAGQDVEPGDGPGRWRIARRTAEDRVISTVDPESRHAHKTRRSYRDGYKAHVAAEPDTGLVTACDIGPGNAGDAEAAPDLITGEPAGTDVLGDSEYGSGEFRDHLGTRDMTAVIKPPPLRPAVPGGYTLDDFRFDLDAGTVTCPEDITVTITRSGSARFGAHCTDCPVRARRTTAERGRVIKLHPHHGLLAAARVLASTENFDATYRQHRPMIERTTAWLVKDNHRLLRYRGIEANRLGWSHRCAAVNLKRLLALGLTHNDGWTIATPA